MPLKRVFLDWEQPALPAAVDFLVHRFAEGDTLDLSGVILVFPGRRAARRLLELLVQRAGSRWPALTPPRITTFNGLPEMLYPQKLRLADDLTQLLVWRKALYAVPEKKIRAALPHRPGEESVNSWMALCESLRSQHNELAADGFEFDEVFEKLSIVGNREEAGRWQALRVIQAEYLMQMDALNLWDRQAARLIAVQQQECHTDSQIILIGTVDMNRIVRQMLAQVADQVTALIHAPESECDSFDEFGCVRPDIWENRRLDVSLADTRIAESPSDQTAVLVREIASFDGRFRADDITIGVADDRMVPVILQALADSGVSGQWPVGMTMAETRPWRLLQSLSVHLASARDDMPPDFATLSDFVRHPDIYAWITRTLSDSSNDNDQSQRYPDWLSSLDRYRSEHLQITPGVMLGDAPTRTTVAKVCRAVEMLLRCLVTNDEDAEAAISSVGRVRPGKRPTDRQKGTPRQLTFDDQELLTESLLSHQLARRRSLADWAEGVIRVLSVIYHDRKLNAESSADRGIAECVSLMQDLLEQLRQIPDVVLPECTATQALQLLLRQISRQTIPPESDPEAIDLLGWLELPLDDSPVLLLTGFNEGQIPESITADAFMPNSLRSRLELTDNRRRYARDAYALTALLHSRRRIILIKGRTDSQGNPLSPSRLWFAADPKSLPQRVRWFYEGKNADHLSDDEDNCGSDTTDPAKLRVRGLSGFQVPKPADVRAAPAEISVTDFREYIQCPYRYFLRRELRLQTVDDDVRELSGSAFGNLMHDVLREFGSSPLQNARSAKEIETYLINTLHRESLARFGRTRSATVNVQLKMLESRLIAFAEWQAENRRDGWAIAMTERKLTCDDFSDIHGRPVKLVGRVDRIDQHDRTGHWRILDYKSGENAEPPEKSHRSKGEWVDLQLPLYRLLVRSLRSESLEIERNVQLGYIVLPGDLRKLGVELADWTDEELCEAEDVARNVAADILDLKIARVAAMNDLRYSDVSRICQDTVIDRNIPWLTTWSGRSSMDDALSDES